jgi:hypothetical protein
MLVEIADVHNTSKVESISLNYDAEHGPALFAVR